MDILFFTHFLNALCMIALPIGLGMFLTHRFHLPWRIWWIGAATFVLSQAGHIPFNSLLTLAFQRGWLPNPPLAWVPYFNPVVLGLSAGLWEELSRYAVLRFWLKDARSWAKGVLFGAGHGGIEALIFGGLAMLAFFQFAGLRHADLASLVPAGSLAALQQQVTAYWSAAWPATLLGAVERLFALPAHIAFAVLVMQVFTRRQGYWLWLAVALHALLDGVSVYLLQLWKNLPWGIYGIEGVIGLFALAMLAILFRLRAPEPPVVPAVEETREPPVLAPSGHLPGVETDNRAREETAEALDRTRFQ